MTYISIKQILDDILVDPLMASLPLERAINYTVEFCKIVGMPTIFEDRERTITIAHYRGELPTDLYEIVQVRNKDGVCYIYSTDTHTIDSTLTNPSCVNIPYTYKVQGNYIYVSKEDDTLTIVYRAFKTDDEGYPMIVDNASFIRALELYIQKKWFTILFNSNKITANVLSNTQQEYAFAVGQAQASLVRPTLDQAQSLSNMLNALLPRARAHTNSFKTIGLPEVRRF